VTALGIVALLPLPLEAAIGAVAGVGIALNGTSSVLYGSVPDSGDAGEAYARLRHLLHRHDRRGRGVAGDLRSARRAAGVPWALSVVAAVVLLTLPVTLMLRPALAAQTA